MRDEQYRRILIDLLNRGVAALERIAETIENGSPDNSLRPKSRMDKYYEEKSNTG